MSIPKRRSDDETAHIMAGKQQGYAFRLSRRDEDWFSNTNSDVDVALSFAEKMHDTLNEIERMSGRIICSFTVGRTRSAVRKPSSKPFNAGEYWKWVMAP